MTQLELARKKIVTDEMSRVAAIERQEPEYVRDGIEKGTIVIPKNSRRQVRKICGIGKGLRTKINANIGTSMSCDSVEKELGKLEAAISFGADTVMDLSTGADPRAVREAILRHSAVPVGTVPIYEVVVESFRRKRRIADIAWPEIAACLRGQAEEGVDFFTVHCGVTREAADRVKADERLLGVVSRGGAFLVEWMWANNRENPFFENFQDILNIARKYDITLSLGDGMRPGAISDASDRAQIQELITLGGLARRAREYGVQAMIEGPGHVPIDQIEANVKLEKSLCGGAPFYVLGPLVTDIAPGYDHITSAIGGAVAAWSGADFLCVVTPSEHLSLPAAEDIREGVIAARIAAHAADVAKGVKGAVDHDIMISTARRRRDWKSQIDLSIDPARAREYRERARPGEDDVCSMCDRFCSIRIFGKAADGKG